MTQVPEPVADFLRGKRIAVAGVSRQPNGASPAEALVNRDPVTGTLYHASLAVFAVLPWFLSRRWTRAG